MIHLLYLLLSENYFVVELEKHHYDSRTSGIGRNPKLADIPEEHFKLEFAYGWKI